MRSAVWQLCTVPLICVDTAITYNLLKLLPEGSFVGSRGVVAGVLRGREVCLCSLLSVRMQC